jgi:exopolysaccharide production protein ExoZ
MGVQKDRLPGITALRALAALSVVAAHALSVGAQIKGIPLEQVVWLPFGAVGVLLFFAISGYVIGLTRHVPSREFAVRRAIRIYPPFWIACVIAFIGISATGADANIFDLRMLLLIPATQINGSLSIPYWTLLFEVAFYVAAGAVFSLRLSDRALSLMTAAWISAILLSLGHFTSGTTAIPGAFILLSPYCLFFAFGLLICLNEKLLLRAGAGVLALVAFALALVAEMIVPLPPLYWIAPTPVLLLSAAAASLIVHLASRIRAVPSAMLAVGNSSYGLYLLHVPVMLMILPALSGVALAQMGYAPYVVMFAFPVSAGVAFGLFEFRMHSWLAARMRGPRKAARMAAQRREASAPNTVGAADHASRLGSCRK